MGGKRGSVLIVEDESETTTMYQRWLGTSYDLHVSQDGECALETLDETVDVVVLDRRMPGVSGESVLERIRTSGLNCRVVVVSAAEPDYDIVETGFDDYIQKPVTETQLSECVERLLRRSAYSRDLREFYALAAQRAALEETKHEDELRDSDVYRRVSADLDELGSRLDEYVSKFDHEDVRVALRDVVSTTCDTGDALV